jgi:hypothetical protein
MERTRTRAALIGAQARNPWDPKRELVLRMLRARTALPIIAAIAVVLAAWTAPVPAYGVQISVSAEVPAGWTRSDQPEAEMVTFSKTVVDNGDTVEEGIVYVRHVAEGSYKNPDEFFNALKPGWSSSASGSRAVPTRLLARRALWTCSKAPSSCPA